MYVTEVYIQCIQLDLMGGCLGICKPSIRIKVLLAYTKKKNHLV